MEPPGLTEMLANPAHKIPKVGGRPNKATKTMRTVARICRQGSLVLALERVLIVVCGSWVVMMSKLVPQLQLQAKMETITTAMAADAPA
eukprot:COSAG02_NODE_4138_length_5725_cov_20.138287_7_plen_89_part_00